MGVIDHRPAAGDLHAEPHAGMGRRARRSAHRRRVAAAPDLESQVAAAIQATTCGFAEPRWRQWAEGWIANIDRTEAAAHLAFAVADAAVDSGGLAEPPVPHPAAAPRTAAQLAIGLARVAALRRIGEHSIASALARLTAAMADRMRTRAAMCG